MKFIDRILALSIIGASIIALQSCNKDNINDRLYTALVTYEADEDGVRLQLNDSTTLIPTNVKPSLFKGKKVRALIDYTIEEGQNVKVHTIDSIRTKLPAKDLGEDNDKTYGIDRLEIVNDWVTVAEDGYLTLRIRTHRGSVGAIHYINLVSKGVKDGVYEYELRHDASGDIYGYQADALIAFDLNELAPEDHSPVKLHLKWAGFNTNKDISCNLTFRKLK